MIRVVTSQLGFTRAFSIRVLITRNVVPTVIRDGKDIRDTTLATTSKKKNKPAHGATMRPNSIWTF